MKMEKMIRARADDEVIAMFAELREIYGVKSDSELLRLMTIYIHRKRPVLTPAPVAPKRKPKED